jgi:hypothetical protein
MHLYPWKAFQLYHEGGKRNHGLKDLNMTNKTNELPSFIHKLHGQQTWVQKYPMLAPKEFTTYLKTRPQIWVKK